MEKIVNGIVIREGKYLAVREAKDWYWKLPGGEIEDNESPEAALIREFEEELNISGISITRKIAEFPLNFKGRNFYFHSYLVEIAQDPSKTFDEDNLQFEWQPLVRMLNTKDQAPSQQTLYQRLTELGLT